MIPRLGLLSSALPGASAGEVCEAARSEGLDGVEWAYGPGEALGPGAGAGAAVSAAAGLGLAVCGLAVQEPDALDRRRDSLVGALEAAAAVGAGQVRVFAPAYRGGPVAGELAAAASTLASAASLAAAAGVALVVELSPRTLAPGPEWFLRLAGGSGGVLGAVYDPGSMMIEGHVPPALAVGALGAAVRHVHVKDVAPRRVGRGWRWDHVPVGEGLVPWPEVIAALAGAGYGRWMVFDHVATPPSVAGLHADVEALRSLLRSAGRVGDGVGDGVGGSRGGGGAGESREDESREEWS